MPANKKPVTWATFSRAQKMAAVGITLVFFVFSGVYFYRGFRSFESLDKIQGVVLTSKLLRNSSRAQPFIVAFQLQNSNIIFGVYEGQNQLEAAALLSRIAPHSFLTVYYDSTGFQADDINLHVYQLAQGHQIIYTIQEKRSGDLLMATLSLLLALASAFWLTVRMKRTNHLI